MARELRELGAAVLVIDGEDGGEGLTVGIGRLDRLVSPAVAIVPVQLLAWRLAGESGRPPGTYVHATKVTTVE
jgi:fructoselysine-6-P-deglycase FrlB-like protein